MNDPSSPATGPSIRFAQIFLDAIGQLRECIPPEVDCTLLDEALRRESRWPWLLSDQPLLLLVGHEASSISEILDSVVNGQQLLEGSSGVLVANELTPSRHSVGTDTIECLCAGSSQLFGRQVLYLRSTAGETLLRAASHWASIVAYEGKDIPSALLKGSVQTVTLTIGHEPGTIEVRSAAECRDEEASIVGHSQVWLELNRRIHPDSWPRAILKVFQRMAEPLRDTRDGLALARHRVAGRLKKEAQDAVDLPGWLRGRLLRCGNRIASEASRVLMLQAAAVWSICSENVQVNVSVETLLRGRPDSSKSWLERLIEGFVGEVPDVERIERVSYELKASLVDTFKQQVITQVRSTMRQIEKEDQSAIELVAKLDGMVAERPEARPRLTDASRSHSQELLQRVFRDAYAKATEHCVAVVEGVASVDRSFSKEKVDSGLCGVIEDRLRDVPVENPTGFFATSELEEAGEDETVAQIVAPWVAKDASSDLQLQGYEAQLLAIEEEARSLVDWAGTFELAAQEDLASWTGTIRRAVRLNAERRGQSGGVASSFARSLARLLA